MDDRTDVELLTLAAKAAGMQWSTSSLITHDGLWITYPSVKTHWNPLTDDGDALRLVVAIGFSDEEGVSIFLADKEDPTVVVRKGGKAGAMELAGNDPCAATRRAITRAAAEIQLAKESGK